MVFFKKHYVTFCSKLTKLYIKTSYKMYLFLTLINGKPILGVRQSSEFNVKHYIL